VDALVVYDGAACGRELLELRRAMGVSLAVGLGVVSLGATEAPRAVRLAAGVYPVRADPDERLAVWLDSGRAAPGWWTGLGRDAATLAWAAVEGLSEVATEANAVQASRLEATSRLASARAELWTSDERSFNSNRRLERVIRVLEP